MGKSKRVIHPRPIIVSNAKLDGDIIRPVKKNQQANKQL